MAKAPKGSAPQTTESQTTLNIRKAPKFLTFLLTGALFGVAAAFIIDALNANNPLPVNGVPVAGILGYLVLFLGALGGGIGVVVAVVLDWVFVARAKRVPATKLER